MFSGSQTIQRLIIIIITVNVVLVTIIFVNRKWYDEWER